jgi:hypothetical protein
VNRLERFERSSAGAGDKAVRVIDLDSGETLQAGDDEDLVKVVLEQLRRQGEDVSEDEVRKLVAERAYDATDS